jgi:hypothetical protein
LGQQEFLYMSFRIAPNVRVIDSTLSFCADAGTIKPALTKGMKKESSQKFVQLMRGL